MSSNEAQKHNDRINEQWLRFRTDVGRLLGMVQAMPEHIAPDDNEWQANPFVSPPMRQLAQQIDEIMMRYSLLQRAIDPTMKEARFDRFTKS